MQPSTIGGNPEVWESAGGSFTGRCPLLALRAGLKLALAGPVTSVLVNHLDPQLYYVKQTVECNMYKRRKIIFCDVM